MASDQPEIITLDVHRRLANWTFGDLSDYQTVNLTGMDGNVFLCMDNSSYSNLPGINISAKSGGTADNHPDIAVSSQGEYIVAWYRASVGYRAQLFYADGGRKGDELSITNWTGFNPGYGPKALFDSKDNIIVAWGDSRGIYCRRLTSDGNSLGGELLIATGGRAPQTSRSPKDTIVVTWMGNDTSNDNIYAQLMGPNGSLLGNRVTVCIDSDEINSQAVAMDSHGNFTVTWSKMNGTTSIRNIFFQRFEADGNGVGGIVQPFPSFKNQTQPTIAINSKDNFIITWADNWHSDPFGLTDIFAQRFDPSGNKLGEKIGVCTYSGDEFNPEIAVDSLDNLFIAWNEHRQDAISGVYIRLFDSNGTALGSEIPLQAADGIQDEPAIAVRPDEEFVMAWSQGYMPGEIHCTYVCRFLRGAYNCSGSLTTNDITVENLFEWGFFSASISYEDPLHNQILFYYSLDGGNSWPLLSQGSNLSKLEVSTGKIRFRAIFSTAQSRSTPVLHSLELGYTINNPPVILSLSPSTLNGAFRRENINLDADARDPDNDTLKYRWSRTSGPPVFFENDGTSTPSFTPSFVGFYQFRLTVSDGYSESPPAFSNVTVINRAPIARIWSENAPIKGLPLEIHGEIIDPDDDSFVWNWVLASSPPGTTIENASGMDPTINCPSSGSCMVSLMVRDELGAITEETANFTFVGRPPVSKLSSNHTQARPGANFEFSGADSYDPDGDRISYKFDFGDGNQTGWISMPRAAHSYSSPGEYHVSLTLIDSDNMTSIPSDLNVTVLPYNAPPRAAFLISDGNLNRPFTFTSSSMDDDGRIVLESWDFGDGENGTGPVVSHMYRSGGSFTVILTVTDNEGIQAICSSIVMVNRPPALRSFSPGPNPTALVGGRINFSADAMDPDGDRLTYTWFLDGVQVKSGNDTYLVLKFERPGLFNLSLKITDARGDSADHSWNITVKSRPDEVITIKGGLTGIYIVLIIVGLIGLFILGTFLGRRKGRH